MCTSSKQRSVHMQTQARKSYATDLTHQQWAILEPLIPPAKHGGRPPVDMREVINTILYLNRGGCAGEGPTGSQGLLPLEENLGRQQVPQSDLSPMARSKSSWMGVGGEDPEKKRCQDPFRLWLLGKGS